MMPQKCFSFLGIFQQFEEYTLYAVIWKRFTYLYAQTGNEDERPDIVSVTSPDIF